MASKTGGLTAKTNKLTAKCCHRKIREFYWRNYIAVWRQEKNDWR